MVSNYRNGLGSACIVVPCGTCAVKQALDTIRANNAQDCKPDFNGSSLLSNGSAYWFDSEVTW